MTLCTIPFFLGIIDFRRFESGTKSLYNQSHKPLSGGMKMKRTEPIRDVEKLKEFLSYYKKQGEYRNHVVPRVGAG